MCMCVCMSLIISGCFVCAVLGVAYIYGKRNIYINSTNNCLAHELNYAPQRIVKQEQQQQNRPDFSGQAIAVLGTIQRIYIITTAHNTIWTLVRL